MKKNAAIKRLFALALSLIMLAENAPVMTVRVYAEETQATVSQEEQQPAETTEVASQPAVSGETQAPSAQPEQPKAETPAAEPPKGQTNPTEASTEPSLPEAAQETGEEPKQEAEVFQSQEENATPVEEDAELSFELQVNGTAARGLSVAYGETLTFSLAGHTTGEVVTYSYATQAEAEKGNWNTIGNGPCTLEPGDYLLKYGLNVDDRWMEQEGYSIQVTKAASAAPSGLSWNGSQLLWSAPTATTVGGPLDGSVIHHYEIQVYKDGSPFTQFQTGADTCRYDNFANEILTFGGAGRYTFAVKAAVSGSAHFSDSALSGASGVYVVPRVTVRGTDGIAAVTPADAFLLLPGNRERSSAEISAEILKDYAFTGWSGSGVTFGNAESAKTTVTVDSGYSGTTELEILAHARDTVAPSVERFAGSDGSLHGSAADSQSGIAAYAFSTESSADKVEAWTDANGNTSFDFPLTQGGVYYFHVKDFGGNTASSAEGIQVTQVHLIDRYHTEETKDETVYLIGEDRALPDSVVCAGYLFRGWFASPDFGGEAVTQVEHSTEAPLTFYAKWEQETLSLPRLADINQVYDGQNHTLSVNLSNTGKLTYQWYRDGSPLENATGKSLSVRNVSDSGSYQVFVQLWNDKGRLLGEGTTEAVTVAITPRPVVVQAESKTVAYGDAAPAFTPKYASVTVDGIAQADTGLVSGDEASIAVGSLVCGYRQWDNVGTYPITPENFTSENYTFSYEAGTLTVELRMYTDGVEAKIRYENAEEPWFLYTGEEIRPDVVVTDAKRADARLTEGTDYRLSYYENIGVSEEKPNVQVTFLGNYQGTATLPFAIRQAGFTARTAMADWIYGEEASEPGVEGNLSQGKVSYRYRMVKDSLGKDILDAPETAQRPVDAGTYEVTATIAGNESYLEVTAEPCTFTVHRREITVTSATAEFSYDGLSHSDQDYTVTGTFAPGEGFSYVTVTGKQTDVTEGADNTLEYGLNSATKAENYDIRIVYGKLIVKSLTLTVPSNAAWQADHPGTAAWVAVSKDGLTARYRLQLYARLGEEYRAVGAPVVTGNTEYDFSAAIRSDAQNRQGAAYCFTIQTEPTGENAGNYSTSEVSDKLGALFTVYVTASGDDHVEKAALRRAGTEDDVTSLVLLQGEAAQLTALPQAGYQVIKWELGPGLSQYSNTVRAENLTASLTDSTAKALTEDMHPEILEYRAENTDDDTVLLHFTLTDTVGLAGWMIKTDDTLPDAADAAWVACAGQRYSGTYQPEKAGSFYLFVMDTAGNITRASAPMDVNCIVLRPGTIGLGTERVVLKAANHVLTLPSVADCGFSADGYAFRNWHSEDGGIYEDGGKYDENADAVLTASWTNEHFDYTVNYYYMDAQGNYPAEPSETATYTALYGTVVHADDAGIQRPRTGFQLDTQGEHNESLTVDANHLTMEVYYQRLTYTLTFRYTLPGQEETVETVSFRYGQEITPEFLEEKKPSQEGYSFVGWNFGTSGIVPSTMPAGDITATGSFAANQSTVHLRVYTKDLKGDGYTLDETRSRDITALHGDKLTMSPSEAEKIDGFTYQGAYLSTREPEKQIPLAENAEETFAGTVSNDSYLVLFYDRNRYTVTLNVWQGTVGEGAPKYQKTWDYLYEEDLTLGEVTAEDMETYQQDTWEHDKEYILASYVDWSTGERPKTMPSGDVTITRQFVLQTTGEYQVEVWVEGAVENQYAKQTFTYYGNVATDVSVGTGSDVTVDYTVFRNAIPNFDYYQYKEVGEASGATGDGLEGGTVTTGTVTDTNAGEKPLVLRIFFERKTVEITISYIVQELNGTSTTVATATKRAKWGTTYNYEPLALFDTTPGGVWVEQPDTFNMTGSAPDTFDYRGNAYVVSYSGYYVLDNAGHWPTGTLDTVESLSREYKGTMGIAENRMNIYYTKVDTDNQYYLDVVYNPGNLTDQKNENVPLTYLLDGQSYRIRVANEAYFYQDVKYVPEGKYASYPGLAYYNKQAGNPEATDGRFIYTVSDGNLKDGFRQVSIGGKTYYLSGGYLYIPVADNRFFYGHRTSYSIGVTEPGYSDVTDFLTSYKEARPDDPYAQGAYVYNRSWGSTISYNNSTLVITFRNGNVFHVYYNVNGVVCQQHTYRAGAAVDSIGCDHDLFQKMAGYDIVWYDQNGNKAQPFQITGDVTLYGKYEKSSVESWEYFYYELPDHITQDGKDLGYITSEDFEGLTTSESDGVVSFTYQGSLVMQKKKVVSESFRELSMTTEGHAISGTVYDASNPENRLVGYVQAEGIRLCAYFKRITHTLTVDTAVPDSNPQTVSLRVGQHYSLAAPTREGYTFAGWTFTDAAGAPLENLEVTTGEDGTAVLTCPDADILAKADWTPAEFRQTYLFYYQNSTLGYDTELVAQMRAQEGTTTTIDGKTCQKYPSGGVSYTEGDRTFYYRSDSLTPDNLCAVAVEKTLLQEGTQTVADEAPMDHYGFAYAVWKNAKGESRQLDIGGEYQNAVGMTLEHFYARQANLTLTLRAQTPEGKPLEGVTLSGGGSGYYYGQTVTVSAALPAGYEFRGWYLADDLTTPVCQDSAFTATLTQSTGFVAVMEAKKVSDVTLRVQGPGELTYGYDSSSALTTRVTFPEDADSANYVKAYRWYLVKDGQKEPIGDAAAYSIPRGWNAREYQFLCEVTVARKDNGLEQVYQVSHTLEIQKAPMAVSSSGFTGVYDGASHSVSVQAAGDSQAVIYYAREPLTEENYATAGTRENPEYTAAGTYPVYYYVKDESGNYLDCTGSETVSISAKLLTLRAGSAIYHRTYDGTTGVSGEAKDANSDMGRLAQTPGIYTILGLADGDTMESYVISCTAEFNDAHVSGANKLDLRNIKLVNRQTGEVNDNYRFAPDYQVTLSAYIDRLSLELDWSDTQLSYLAKLQCPKAEIQTPLPAGDSGNLSLTVSGGQINAGSYTASAKLVVEGASDGNDFSLKNGAQPYTIGKESITVAPKAQSGTVIYDGQAHTLDEFEVTEGKLLAGQTLKAAGNSSTVAAGVHTVTACNAHIYDEDGVDVTDNYQVSYGAETLTIQQRTVTVSNLRSADKPYDGNTHAEVDCGSAVFSNVVGGDTLSLDPAKITAAFSDPNVGDGKTVTFTLSEDALTGASAENYRLDVAGSDRTAKASITAGVITVKVNPATTVYGEEAAFTVSYSGFRNGEDESIITGKDTVTYTVAAKGAVPEAYTTQTPAGDYTVYADVPGLRAGNYRFAAAAGSLKVMPRPVSASKAENAFVTKVYDGTTQAKNLVKPEMIVFGEVGGETPSGVVNGDRISLDFAAAYNSPNVLDAETVTLTELKIDNPNYVLRSDALVIPGSITKAPLTVTAENKTVTYGDAVPAFSFRADGFVNAETAAVLKGTPRYATEYNPEQLGYREVKQGGYSITVAGLDADNYSLTFKDGTLTVNKAVITVTAVLERSSAIYGTDPIPKISFAYSGLKYDDSFESAVTGTVSCDLGGLKEETVEGKTVISSKPGTYAVTPVITDLQADNYTFARRSATLTVDKYALKITGVQVRSRVYDGTAAVYPSQIDYSAVQADGLLAIDRAYFEAHKSELLQVTGTYAGDDGKNAGENKQVDLTIAFLDYLNERCYVATDIQTMAQSAIAPRPVKITALDVRLLYGQAAPRYQVTYSATEDPDSGLVAGEQAGANHVTVASSYEAKAGSFSPVGTYPIAVSDFTGSETALKKNYAPQYQTGTLTVEQARLAAPEVSWDGTQPGRALWMPVAGIGDVAVERYTAVLCKDGSAIAGTEITVSAGQTLQADYASLIRANGPGCYTAQVTAHASLEKNEGNKNVADSTFGVSGKLYAASVRFVFAQDATTQQGKGSTISINGGDSYTLIAGERDIPIQAELKNATGYTVSSVVSSSSALTVAGAASPDDNRQGAAYQSTVVMAAGLNSAQPVTVTLTLASRPAELTVTVTPRPGVNQASCVYGYGEEKRPTLKVTAVPGDTGTDYTYSYRWELRYAGTTLQEIHDGGALGEDSWRFPLGMRANDTPTYYTVRCIVTATRQDNGNSYTNEEMWLNSAPYVTNVTVQRAKFDAQVAMTGWTYGQTRNAPQLAGVTVSDNEMITGGKYTYLYRLKSQEDLPENWTTVLPKEAGEYVVKASIPQASNYDAFETPAVSFAVAQAKLSVPEGLNMAPSTTAPYGLISWDAVDGVSENNGVDSASEAKVTYLVKLYRRDGTDTLVKEYAPQTDCRLDITEDLQQNGSYYYTVTALSSNKISCLDSDESAGYDIYMTGTIQASSLSKLYDGEPIVMTALGGAGAAYQWYKGSTPLTGETGDRLSATHVAQSGTYTCVITAGDGKEYTPKITVTITRRKVAMHSASDEKVYDGAPLINDQVTVSGDGFATGEGAFYRVTGSQTDAGQSANAFTYLLNTGTTAGDYTFAEPDFGELRVTPRSLTDLPESGFTYGNTPDVVYRGTRFTPKPAAKDAGLAVEGRTLTEGVDFTYSYGENTDAGAASVTLTGKGNYTGSVTLPFTVLPRPISFVGKTDTVTYNGSEQQLTEFALCGKDGQATDENSGLAEGHTYRLTYLAKGTEASQTPYPGTFTQVKIFAGDVEVTKNYEAAYFPGALTIEKTGESWAVTLADQKCTYTGQLQYSSQKPAATAKTGQTVYEYSFREDGGYTGTLSDLAKVDADTYTIYVRASNPNYRQTAVTTAKLIIDKASCKVITESKQREYNGQPLQAEGRITGLVSGETVTLRTTASITDVGSTANTYRIDWTGAKESNYRLEEEIGTLEITPNSKDLQVSGEDYSAYYDGETHGQAAAATVTAGTTLAYSTDGGKSWSAQYPTVRDAGRVNVLVKAENKNYVTAQSGYTLEVTPKPVTIRVENARKVVGQQDPAFTGTVEGLIDRKDLGTVTYYRDSAAEDPGTYKGVLSARYTENGNYAVTVLPGDFEILAINPLVITASNVTAVYDGSLHGMQPTVSIPEGTTLSYSTDGGKTFTRNLPRQKDVGVLRVLVNAENAKYPAVTAQYTVTVTYRPVTVTAQPGEKTYGDRDPDGFTAEVSGMAEGESAEKLLRYTLSRAAGENAGTYPITVTGEANQGNYRVTYVSADFTIHPRKLQVKWSIRKVLDGSLASSGTSVGYDGSSKTAAAEFMNLVSWDGTVDEVTPKGYKGATGEYRAGSYKTELTGIAGKDAANYVLEEAPFNWTITPKPLADDTLPGGYAQDIRVKDIGDCVYDGTWHFPNPVVTDEGIGGAVLTKGVDYVLYYRDHHDAGTATVRIVGIGNYSMAIEKTFTIRPRPVTLYWDGEEFAYDSQTKRVTARVVDALEGDEVIVGGYRDNAKSDSGEYTARATWLTGSGAGNYTLLGGKNISHKWRIHPAKLTIRADDKESLAGAPLEELTYTVIGTLYGKDEPGILRLDTTAKDTAGTFPITVTVGKSNPNYILSTQDGTYTLVAPEAGATQPTEGSTPTEPEKETEGTPERHCLWHWLIVLADLLFAVFLLLTMKRVEKTVPEEEKTKRARKSRMGRSLSIAALTLFCIAVNILGFCHWELPLSIVSVAGMAILSALLYRRKFASDETAQTANTQ